jgi:protein-L-isoaspartate(D-aspartate) O-methyltransferase
VSVRLMIGGNGHLGTIRDTEAARLKMVAEQIEARGLRSPEVLRAMRKVPRHLFVPEPARPYAYEDTPLAIGEGQTISQPFIVAFMTDLLRPGAGRRVLEVGTGSGYQAAILSEMGAEVFTIEIVESLAGAARSRLTDLGYGRIRFRTGDGTRGWPEQAPFDAIVVTAAPERLPEPLVDQLAIGGSLVVPIGTSDQSLWLVTRTVEGIRREEVLPVRFVPMTGEALNHHEP